MYIPSGHVGKGTTYLQIRTSFLLGAYSTDIGATRSAGQRHFTDPDISLYGMGRAEAPLISSEARKIQYLADCSRNGG